MNAPRRRPNFATIGLLSPGVRTSPARRSGYELRDAAGTVLATSDTAGPLLRNLADKRGCCVVRVRDGEVVARSPEVTVADEAGLESVG